MKKIIVSILLLLSGCVTLTYDAKEEFKNKHIPAGLINAKFDLVVGIQFIGQGTYSGLKGDLASETASWLTNILEEGKYFIKVVNLNQVKNEKVDVILRGIIRSVDVRTPEISGTSKVLGIFYGVAPVLEHYAISKGIESTAIVRYQLIEAKSDKRLWEKVIKERAGDSLSSAKSNKLIVASVTKTVEGLLAETEFHAELKKISSKTDMVYARKPEKTEMIEDLQNIPDFKINPRDADVAIIIGIEKYRDLPSSEYSQNDARIVKMYLTALGFRERNIMFITNDKATLSDINKSIESWLPNRANKNSTLFIYYSGHGAPEPKTGEAYIVPYDGDPNYLTTTGYPLKRLYEKLGSFSASQVIVVLDSCFSGTGGRSVLAKGARPLVMMAESPTLSPNMAIMTATQGSQISSSSPDKRHGIFTYYFLKAIKDGKKDLAEIYDYLLPLVEDEAIKLNVQQTPTINPDIGKIKGRFSLAR